MKNIIDILSKMQEIAMLIEMTEEAKVSLTEQAVKFYNKPHEISAMTQSANDVIADYIKQYRALSAEQSILLREYEIKDCKKPDFSDVGQGNKMVFAHTSHNREIFNDLTKDFAA